MGVGVCGTAVVLRSRGWQRQHADEVRGRRQRQTALHDPGRGSRQHDAQCQYYTVSILFCLLGVVAALLWPNGQGHRQLINGTTVDMNRVPVARQLTRCE